MSVVKKTGFLIISSLLLTACTSYYASIADTTYLKSSNGPDLVVPSPMTKTNLGYFYNLPSQTQDPKVSIEPPSA